MCNHCRKSLTVNWGVNLLIHGLLIGATALALSWDTLPSEVGYLSITLSIMLGINEKRLITAWLPLIEEKDELIS